MGQKIYEFTKKITLQKKKSFVFDDAYIQELSVSISVEADVKLQKLTRGCTSESNNIRLLY